jgi:hypothetical protein
MEATMKKYVLCVTTLIALATAVPAQAALMDFAISPLGGAPSYTGASLDTSTAFYLGGGTYQVSNKSAGDTTGVTVGQALSIVPDTFTYGSATGVLEPFTVTKTFTTTGGSFPGLYTETLTSIAVLSRVSNNISLELFGVLNGPAGSGFVNTPAGLLLNANQAGGPGTNNSVGWSATELSNPPQLTPLPAALPLFASGLGALGLLGWRKKRKNAAAIAAA